MSVREAAPERRHDTLDESCFDQWVVIDEISRVPALLDVAHQRLDREPARRFLLTGPSARAAPGRRQPARVNVPRGAATGLHRSAIAMAFRPTDAARIAPDAVGAAFEGLV